MLGRRALIMTVATAIVSVVAAAAVAGGSLPGPPVKRWLGLSDESFDYPPCEPGMYRYGPDSPPPPSDGTRWRHEARAPGGPAEGSAAAVGPMIYMFNGSGPYHLRTVYALDTRTGKWTEPTKTPVRLNHHWAVAYKGDIYLAGGLIGGEEPTARVWRYDPEANRFSELPPMRQARGATGAAVIDDKLYVVGGGPNAFPAAYVESYGTLEVYDFKTGRWLARTEMPTPRHHVGTAALDGKLYVVGGRDDTDLTLDTFERYDPRTDEWEELPPMPLAQSSAAVVAAGGKIVAFGGEDETDWDEGKGWVTASTWAFDPAANSWQRLPELDVERRAHGGAVVAGRIYALMGSYCPGLTARGPRGTRTVESLPVEYVGRL
jgi:N-acetylneuraminic acid mutarotase